VVTRTGGGILRSTSLVHPNHESCFRNHMTLSRPFEPAPFHDNDRPLYYNDYADLID